MPLRRHNVTEVCTAKGSLSNATAGAIVRHFGGILQAAPQAGSGAAPNAVRVVPLPPASASGGLATPSHTAAFGATHAQQAAAAWAFVGRTLAQQPGAPGWAHGFQQALQREAAGGGQAQGQGQQALAACAAAVALAHLGRCGGRVLADLGQGGQGQVSGLDLGMGGAADGTAAGQQHAGECSSDGGGAGRKGAGLGV